MEKLGEWPVQSGLWEAGRMYLGKVEAGKRFPRYGSRYGVGFSRMGSNCDHNSCGIRELSSTPAICFRFASSLTVPKLNAYAITRFHVVGKALIFPLHEK